MKKKKLNKIGILGGTFDPAHRGHIAISKEAIKNYKISRIIWAVTKKNPFKKESSMSLNERIKYAKKLNKNNHKIKVKFFEDKIKSSRTINLINYLKKTNKNSELFFIMGADNLINFHKWAKWKLISKNCSILVFDRDQYRSKSIKSKTFRELNNKKLSFIKFKKVNISSSQLRKI
ncbi:MAG: nicotinate (nicotinamide) nucleotide adenylyltransferase [Candidatus Pelagibacter sp. TMED275]|nr:MAG: nicotinate (nicotinamide) nucleotide adenylyltransferase [Candidatus Pelagibacter sp. TMED275]